MTKLPAHAILTPMRVIAGIILGGTLLLATVRPQAGLDRAFPLLPPGADLFARNRILRLNLDIAPAEIDRLRRANREFVPATVSEQDRTYDAIGLHLKGSAGSFRPLEDKPSMTLDFGKFRPGQRFHGLRKIHLNNSAEDPSYLNEQLGSELFRAAGVPAPRAGHVLVKLNGRFLGLYILKEGFTEDFLAAHFKTVSGGLYEPVNGGDIDSPMQRKSVFAPKPDPNALQALTDAAFEPDLDRRWQRLQDVLDMDRFLSFMAVETMIGHRDGYCLARNNYRLYFDRDTGKWMFFPHGMDQLWSNSDVPWQPCMAGLMARAVMETPRGSQAYTGRFGFLFTNVFQSNVLARRVDDQVASLRPALHRREYARLKAAAASVKESLGRRQISLARQLRRPFPQQLEFNQGPAQLAGWDPIGAPIDGTMNQGSSPDGVDALHAVTRHDAAASWRTTAVLNQGHYRFEGRVRATGFRPLSCGIRQGAVLRIGGDRPPLTPRPPTSSWQALSTEFAVQGRPQEIEFICEWRASAGDVWFDTASLRVVAVREQVAY